MKVLLLTNQHHIDFIVGYLPDRLPDGVEILVKYTGKYDWSEDYDIGVSFMYQYKVPKEQLAKPWFNFHPAPLPGYKGRDLCYWAIMNGETDFGATLHYMDEEFDTGDIIDVRNFPISDHHTAEDVSRLATVCSKTLFQDYFPRIIAGKQFERLPNVGGVYYTKGGIVDETALDRDAYLSRWIRAVTYKNFYPKIDIGGVTYKIVRDE